MNTNTKQIEANIDIINDAIVNMSNITVQANSRLACLMLKGIYTVPFLWSSMFSLSIHMNKTNIIFILIFFLGMAWGFYFKDL
jgi:hypothetical protein